MAGKPKALRIRGYLILIFSLLLIGIGTAGYVHYQNHKQYARRGKENELLAIANLKLGQILNYRKNGVADAVTIFSNPMVIRHIREWLKDEKKSGLKEEILDYLKSIRLQHEYDSLFLVDAEGKIRLSITYGEESIGSHAKSLIPKAIGERRIIVDDLYRDEIKKRLYLDIFIPIVGEGPHILPPGVLLLRMDPNQFLFPVIQIWPTPSPTAETMLVRREGDEVLFLNELRHQKNTALSLRIPTSRRESPAVMAVSGREGIVEGMDYRGVPVLAAIRAIPDSPWYLIAKIDLEEVDAPIRRQGITIVLMGILLILAAGVSVALLWRNQAARYYQREYQAELERKALRRHYEYLSKYANDIMLLYDSELRIVEANNRAVMSYGYSRDELLQLTAWDLRSPDTKSALDTNLKQVKEQKSLVFETIQQRKDGTTFPVEISVRLIEVEGKEFHQSIVRDITERKRAEDALQKSEKRFRELFDNAPVGYHEFDTEGRITHVNRTELEMMGYTLEEMVGQPIWKFNVDEEMVRETVLAKLSGALPPARDFERVLRRKDGTTFQALIGDRLLRDDQGRITGIRATIQDITERKQVEQDREKLIRELQEALAELKRKEEALRKSEEKFRDLYDHAPIGYHEYDLEGRITNVNQTDLDMLGYTREEMIGQYIWEFNVEKELAREQVLAKLAGTRPPGRGLERTYRRKDGTTLPVLIEDRLIQDAKGSIMGIRCIIQDITERKKAEEEREKLVHELQEALVKVKQLRGLIPICASCKRIRDDKGYWNQVETYIRDRSEAEFSHGICPECMRKLYPEFADE